MELSVVSREQSAESSQGQGKPPAYGSRLTAHHSNYFNDPKAWLYSPMYEAPPEVDVVRVQKEIDAICGVTRNNESIIKLVWNGDRRFWEEWFTQWDVFGKPIGDLEKRPFVKMGTAPQAFVEKGVSLRHVFPPRWILLNRYEPEYYADSWEQDTKIFCPEMKVWKRLKPEQPPSVWWDVLMVVGEHKGNCCQQGWKCHGNHAHPRSAFPALHEMVKANGKANPFASASELAREVKGYYHDYEKECLEQSKKFQIQRIESGNDAERLLLPSDMSFKQQEKFLKDFARRQELI